MMSCTAAAYVLRRRKAARRVTRARAQHRRGMHLRPLQTVSKQMKDAAVQVEKAKKEAKKTGAQRWFQVHSAHVPTPHQPPAMRWRCGKHFIAMGGKDCHVRENSLSESRAHQIRSLTCDRCHKLFPSQIHLAAHISKCALQCMKCGRRFLSQRSVQIHQRSCTRERADAERILQGDDESPVY